MLCVVQGPFSKDIENLSKLQKEPQKLLVLEENLFKKETF